MNGNPMPLPRPLLTIELANAWIDRRNEAALLTQAGPFLKPEALEEALARIEYSARWAGYWMQQT